MTLGLEYLAHTDLLLIGSSILIYGFSVEISKRRITKRFAKCTKETVCILCGSNVCGVSEQVKKKSKE